MTRQRGVTIVELLVTLAVMAVLAGVVFPGFRAIVARNSLATSANAFVSAVALARSEAVRSGDRVRLGASAPTDSDDEWGPGWVVEDDAGNLLRTFEGLADPLEFDSEDDVDELFFNGEGGLEAAVDRVFTLCIPGGAGLRITISPVGRPSMVDFAGC